MPLTQGPDRAKYGARPRRAWTFVRSARALRCAAAVGAMIASTTLSGAAAPKNAEDARPSRARLARVDRTPPLTPAELLDRQRHDLVNATMGLTRSTLVALDQDLVQDHDQDMNTGAHVTTTVPFEDRTWTLDLHRRSTRAENYRLFRSNGPGDLVEIAPGAVRTMRGVVNEDDGSVVSASIAPDGLRAVVQRSNGERYWIEPVAHLVDGLAANTHVLYHESDTEPHGASCASEAMRAAEGDGVLAPAPALNGPPAESAGDGPIATAELACDADYEYFLDYGSSVSAVEARINLITDTMNLQYESEVGITHVITAIIVRTAPGTYTSSVPITLLEQFRTQWFQNHSLIQRDVAELFTGRDLTGNVVGLAWTVGAICTPSAYCLVQSDYNGNVNCATDLSAHELGHLWGADHCDPCSTTMRSAINCSNTFGTASVTAITAHRDSRTCLEPVGTYCQAFVSSTGFEHIANVTFGDIDNSSGSDGYSDFTSIATDLSAGQSVPFTMTLGTGASTDIGAVWIDWNDDGDFFDAGEAVDTSFSGSGPYTTTVNVPGTVATGLSRMRVRVQDGAANPTLDPCAITSFGEVEDYAVNLSDQPPPANDNCGSPTPIGVESMTFSTFGASTDGPSEPQLCDANGDDHIRADVWFELTAPCFGLYTVSLCGSSFNTRVGVYGTCPTDSLEIIACNDDFCGNQSEVQFAATPGQVRLIRVGGFMGEKGEGTININVECLNEGACCLPTGVCDLLTENDCTTAGGTHHGTGTDCNPIPCPPPCPEDIDGSGDVGFGDILELITSWGPCPGCPGDLDGSGDIGFADILEVITAWGPC